MIFPVTNSSACSGAMVMNALGSGSHIRLQSSIRGYVHHVTVPDHKSLRLGTLNKILSDVADYLNIERSQLAQELFEK